MKRVLLTTCLGLFAAYPAFAQHIGNGSTDPSPNADQIVLGTYNIKTNGDSGPYTIPDKEPGVKSATRQEEENSEWNLTFKNIGGALCMHANVNSWMHKTTTTKTFVNNGPATRQVTIVTQNLLKGRTDPNARPNQCNQSAVQTYPADGPVTLTITHSEVMTPPSGVPNFVHKRYRALVLSSGSSLPEIMVSTQTTMNGVVQPGSPYQILNAYLLIRRWDKASWTADYAGNLSVVNDDAHYKTPEGYQWLTVTANWDTEPK